ncbi:MAG TPA: carboxypeptidase-like regulatory domain-containing protein [Candidatus Binataceae bacterium]|nr:carboxypeptidase-like regulatory domain-containing protein [Candidatus Binataceae bacterium]
MFTKSSIAIGLLSGLLLLPPQAYCADIAGKVANSQDSPALPAHVSVKDKNGSIVGQADADSVGHYRIRGLSSGEYDITLNLPGTKYLGQTIQTGLRPEGLCLDWRVSETAAALATGRPGATLGACEAAAAAGSGAGLGLALGAGAVVVGGGVIGGLAAGGVFNGGGGGTPPKPASPGI